jgi:hypothetical protein
LGAGDCNVFKSPFKIVILNDKNENENIKKIFTYDQNSFVITGLKTLFLFFSLFF